MSAAFTTPTGEQLQRLAFYNELQLAYSERKQAIGQGASDPFVEDAYWQSLGMYQTWQSWLETYCTSFIDHVSGPFNPGGTAFLSFTLASWRAAAGLNADGFSRFDKDGNSLGNGIAAEDDAICANTFDELQKGFSVLKWTEVEDYQYTLLERDGRQWWGSDTGWFALDPKQLPGESTMYTYPRDLYRVVSKGPPLVGGFSTRVRSKIRIGKTTSFCPVACYAYLRPIVTDTPVVGAWTYFDFDSLGMTENQFWFWGNSNEGATTELSIGYIETEPWTIANPWLAVGTLNGGITAPLYQIYKWNFTNA